MHLVKPLSFLCLLLLWCGSACPGAVAAESPRAARSPRNQIYQFVAKGPEGIHGHLWIPETCARLRGLLVFSQNVPETLIAGHPLIRKVCAERQLGILYTVPGFWRGKVEDFREPGRKREEATRRLVDMLTDLAGRTGYPEVATVPWLPIGESMSILMVRGLINEMPERCIAGIFASDINYGADRTVPILGLQGTGSEWEQDKSDLRTQWRKPGNYQRVCDLRKEAPGWPVTMMVEAGGGHFSCSETMIACMASYIDQVVPARLPVDGGDVLRPIAIGTGVLAHLPLAGKSQPAIDPARDAVDTARPWFFDRADAERYQAIAAVDWQAATQLPGVLAGDHCTVRPWGHRGVTKVEIRTDGEFSLKPILLGNIPEGFVAAGEPLARSQNTPAVEWVSGPLVPLGNDRFHVDVDRNHRKGTVCMEVVVAGGPGIRLSVQPLLVDLLENSEGKAQVIDFRPIADVPAGTASITLAAPADSGLPVRFTVESGPAVIEGDRLSFTPLPPRTHFPVEIGVIAWQWGTCAAPLYRTTVVRQTFRLLGPQP